MDRIKFYSINDLTYGHYLKKIQSLINDYESGKKEVKGINDIIELYNIKKYIDNKVYLLEWTPSIIERFEKIIKKYFEVIAKFIKSISNDSLESIYSEIDLNFKNDFWELFNKLKAYENISEEKFQELINASKVPLQELLKFKNITEYFGKIVRDRMLNDNSSAELLLDKYELRHIREEGPIFLPKELSNSDKETIICNYIDSEDPNWNYLRLIANIQSSKDKIEISPKILLKAKRKAEGLEKQLFKENSGMKMETSVVFSKSQDAEITFNIDGQSVSATYSTKWIENNDDYATLLNNFIYLFEFVDLQIRCTLVNKMSEMGVFERYLITSSQNAYIKGIAFDSKNILSFLQLSGYYSQLFSFGIRIEEVIEWFFEEYLPIEFDIHNFKVSMPSVNSTFLEKCTNIMPALESILKQFIIYVEERQIDFELLEMRSEHLIYKNIPSLVNKKYVYGIGEEYQTVTYLVFSDQSNLSYLEKTEKSYKNFYELLSNEKIKLSDIPDYNASKVNWLINHKYLFIDEEGYIIFYNKQLIVILYDLYINDVAVYWKYSDYSRRIMDELKNRNIIEFESTLFSRPEQDYINYTLNKSQFNNGLDLRNSYSHTQPNSGDNEKLHNQNYLIFLRLFIISLIKINDDFCTASEIEKYV